MRLDSLILFKFTSTDVGRQLWREGDVSGVWGLGVLFQSVVSRGYAILVSLLLTVRALGFVLEGLISDQPGISLPSVDTTI